MQVSVIQETLTVFENIQRVPIQVRIIENLYFNAVYAYYYILLVTAVNWPFFRLKRCLITKAHMTVDG